MSRVVMRSLRPLHPHQEYQVREEQERKCHHMGQLHIDADLYDWLAGEVPHYKFTRGSVKEANFDLPGLYQLLTL